MTNKNMIKFLCNTLSTNLIATNLFQQEISLSSQLIEQTKSQQKDKRHIFNIQIQQLCFTS